MHVPVLIERAQFAHNPRMYTKDGFADVLHRDGFTGSWLEWLLRETETSHGASLFLSRCIQSVTDAALERAQPRSAATTGAFVLLDEVDLLDSLALGRPSRPELLS